MRAYELPSTKMIIGPQKSCEIERFFVLDRWVDSSVSTRSSCIDQPGSSSMADGNRWLSWRDAGHAPLAWRIGHPWMMDGNNREKKTIISVLSFSPEPYSANWLQRRPTEPRCTGLPDRWALATRFKQVYLRVHNSWDLPLARVYELRTAPLKPIGLIDHNFRSRDHTLLCDRRQLENPGIWLA